MTQLSGNEFEDDLIVGMEEENTFSTESIDLFGITGDDDSPIARLKSIILSIDWEITDKILKQLDDELLDLGEIWADDKIKLVYVQGLSKIGKYIFKEKAGAHPDAIKLLLTFYHNLEKVVLDDNLGNKEKKQLLLSDVKKFDQLKEQIGQPPAPPGGSPAVETVEHESVAATGELDEDTEDVKKLKGLKALVLGIDWEINDVELKKIGTEVTRLEGVFATDRPKLILLQGIGALSAYINKMRSKSKRRAFVLIHSFYDVLENISRNTLSASEEKQSLLAEVSKFKEFKTEIATQQSGDTPAVASQSDLPDEQNIPEPASPIAQEESPALMSVSETTIEEVVPSDEIDVSDDVSSRLSSVFGDDDFEDTEFEDSDKSKALEGVNVETEADDDSDEDALPFEDGTVAPALAEMDKDSSFSVERLAEDLSVAPPTVAPEAIVGDDIEIEDDVLDIVDIGEAEEKDPFLQGTDVETEADDDSNEDSLPMTDGTLAPALSGTGDDGGFDAESFSSEFDEADSDAIENRLGDFFDDEVATSSESWGAEKEAEIIEADDETPGDEEGLIAALSEAFDDREEDEVEESEAVLVADDEQFENDGSLVSTLSAFDVEDDDTEESLAPALSAFDGEENNDDEGSLASALSAFDEEDDNGLSLDAEQVHELDDEEPEDEENLVAALSQFDDDIDGAIAEKVETKDEDLDNGESLVAAFSDIDDEEIADIEGADQIETVKEAEEAEIEQELEFFKEEVTTPALSEPETDPELEPKVADDIVVEEEAENEVDIELAFRNEAKEPSINNDFVDEDASPVAGIIEDEKIAVKVESDDVADDDDIEITDNKNDTEEDFIEFDTPEEGEGVSVADITEDEKFAFEVESDDIGDDEEIEITVPGAEITDNLIISDDKSNEEEDDDSIEFAVPAEAEKSPLLFNEQESSDEIVFETVGDEVAVDLLPGESPNDSETLATEFNKAEDVEKSSTGKYESLATMGATLQKNVTTEVVQDIFVELDKLSSAKEIGYTDKIFLQLLSTVCQYIEKNKTDERAISLMQDVVSGLEMCDNESGTSDNVQEALFSCTSRLLVFKREEIVSLKSGFSQEPIDDSPTNSDLDDERDSETVPTKVLGDDEQLASFVQKELSDIRKLFVEEIGSLRKELSGKHKNIE